MTRAGTGPGTPRQRGPKPAKFGKGGAGPRSAGKAGQSTPGKSGQGGADRKTSRGWNTGAWLLIGTLAASVVGFMVTLQVLDWIAIYRESGGSCGTSRGISYGDCPRYWGTIFVVSLFGLMAFIPLLLFALIRTRLAGALVGVVAAALAVYPAAAVFGHLHGDTWELAWAAPSDRTDDGETGGIWHIDGDAGTVVRIAFDGLTAFDVASGTPRWSAVFPDRDVLCAMSRTASEGIGLIARHDENTPCADFGAVDLATGRILWESTAPGGLSDGPDILAVTGDTAVVLGEDSVRGFALRDGAPRWQFRLPESTCGDSWLAAGRYVVVAVERCTGLAAGDDGGPELWALDPATGAVAWTVPVPFEGARRVTRIASEPLVVHVTENGRRGRSAFVAFDDSGAVTATIETGVAADTAESELLPLRTFDISGFDAAPVTRTVVTGNTLVAVARAESESGYRLVAHDLLTGVRQWTGELLEDDPDALVADGDRVVVVVDNLRVLGLGAFDLRTGAESHAGVAVVERVGTSLQVVALPEVYLVLGSDGSAPYRPLQAVARP
ncbi:outer membrane protein assembly factor BamB family protein [Nocardia shimofusensis]|uniref:outer membrane protein assembly factor BamB family protein n=1 Tax=Nocardia shimofusensis TaxID=228596 RepID=UPI00082A80AD|nr:PQQ-binding-like beta-propeller repeat protein [Nocardia shimofusensis]